MSKELVKKPNTYRGEVVIGELAFESSVSYGDTSKPRTLEEWWEYYGRMRPNLTTDMPPEDIKGSERLIRAYWGHELMAFSLVYVAGKQRFKEVIPDDLPIHQSSIAQTNALFVMVASSLHWATQNQEIDKLERGEKVLKIGTVFGLHQDWVLPLLENSFQQSLKQYHGHYPYYEPKSFDGSEAIKIVRERLDNQPIVVPKILSGWIKKPTSILSQIGSS